MRAVDADGYGSVASGKPVDVCSDLGHRARALVADDVRGLPDRATKPVERVAALNAHGLDVDQDVARPHHRVGHLFVAEDIG